MACPLARWVGADWSRTTNPMRPRGRQRVPLQSGIRSQNLSISYLSSNQLAANSIFGIYSGPIVDLANDPDSPSHEQWRRVLLDPVVRAALRDRPAARARVAPRGPAFTRRHTPAVAGGPARPARRGGGRADGAPGEPALSPPPN